ncbi:MAG: hypothetical protein EPN86_00680 [Nanoarchaeota archaeon]|nr:MAG: hypothetical protein EPN86_00680 [Nanoarchaeota archaeon]
MGGATPIAELVGQLPSRAYSVTIQGNEPNDLHGPSIYTVTAEVNPPRIRARRYSDNSIKTDKVNPFFVVRAETRIGLNDYLDFLYSVGLTAQAQVMAFDYNGKFNQGFPVSDLPAPEKLDENRDGLVFRLRAEPNTALDGIELTWEQFPFEFRMPPVKKFICYAHGGFDEDFLRTFLSKAAFTVQEHEYRILSDFVRNTLATVNQE